MPLPSRRAPLPQLGSFVGSCIAGGALTLSDVLGAARNAAAPEPGGAPGAEAVPAQRIFLALLWVASQHNAARPFGAPAAERPARLPAGAQLRLQAADGGDVEIRMGA